MKLVIFTSVSNLPRTAWSEPVDATLQITDVLIYRYTGEGMLSNRAQRLIRLMRERRILASISRGIAARLLARRSRAYTRTLPSARMSRVSFREVTVGSVHDSHHVTQVAEFGADLGLSIGGPVLPAAIFSLPRLGTVNIHLGNSCRFRGTPPGFWEFQSRAGSVGATLHVIDNTIDAGPIVACVERQILARDSLEDVEESAFRAGLDLLCSHLGSVISGHATSFHPEERGRYYTMPRLLEYMAVALRATTRRCAD